MIKLVVGGLGSGKTVAMVRSIIKRDTDCFSNFHMKHPKMERIEVEHIIKEEVIGQRKNGDVMTKKVVNWDFWKDRREKRFDIYLDEVHNILSSRRSMSSWNVCFTQWLAQIRKTLGSSERNHLFLMSQNVSRIDTVARDLATEIIYVKKYEFHDRKVPTKIIYQDKLITKMLPFTAIRSHIFSGEDCLERLYAFRNAGMKTYDRCDIFYANPYFKYYDSFSFVEFGQGVYI